MKPARFLPALGAEVVVPLVVVAGLTWYICASGLDMALARHAYDADAGAWTRGDEQPWRAFYRFGPWPAILLTLAGLITGIGALGIKSWRRHARAGWFVFLAMALGPGILVNVIFKPHWGRPRPRQIVEFGGDLAYQPVWQRGEKAPGRTSFPSGHSSVGFFLLVPFFLQRRRSSRAFWWLVVGGIGGGIMGYTRILQGGHFLSDVLWAGFMVYAAAWIVAWLILRESALTSE